MTDALGNTIKVGGLYGYSHRSNGVCTVIIGNVTKMNKESVTLEIVHRGKAVYSHDIEEDKIVKPTSSVASNTLFPLESSDVVWVANKAKNLLLDK